MYYQDYPPHPLLREDIRCFWALEEDHTPENANESVTPDSYIELIFNVGDPCWLPTEGLTERAMPTVFMMGLQDKPLTFRAEGTTRVVGVRCYAWGALAFTKLPPPAANNIITELSWEWQRLARQVQAQALSGDYRGAVSCVEAFLLEKRVTAIAHREPSQKQLQIAAQQLYQSQGQVRIAELAGACGLSVRQLQRHFSALIGVSPKTFAQSIRFEAISNRLFADPTSNLLDLTYEFGYTDQAHFIHDFKTLAQKTPGAFAEAMKTR